MLQLYCLNNFSIVLDQTLSPSTTGLARVSPCESAERVIDIPLIHNPILRQIKLSNPRTRLGHVVHQLLVEKDRREFHLLYRIDQDVIPSILAKRSPLSADRLRLFPDIASRIPPLEPNHVANPIVLDRKISNLFIKREGSAIARQARPPHHWFPGNCFGHVDCEKRVREYSIPSLALGEKDQFLATGLSTGVGIF